MNNDSIIVPSVRCISTKDDEQTGTPKKVPVLHNASLCPLSTIPEPQSLTYREQWGPERGIDSILLDLNTQDWGAIPEALGFSAQLAALEPLALYMGEKIEREARQYATGAFKALRQKYGSGGFSLEGINPTTGQESGYPRFRAIAPFRYFQHGKLKEAKYLSRKGSSTQDFYARVPLHIAEQIADRYKLVYPHADGNYAGFWQWVKENALPIVLAEGEGDALAVLSRGYVAIGIPGHNMAFQKGTLDLRPELLQILEGGSPVTIAFDRDDKPKTIAAVEHSRQKLSRALEQFGTTVSIAYWETTQGKGAGDLPAEVLDQAILSAGPPEPMGERITRWVLQDPWQNKFDHVIYGKANLEAFLKTLEEDCFIHARTGAGKTEALQVLSQDESLSHIAVAPLRSLTYGLANTLDLAVFNDSSFRGIDDRIAVVINSLHKVKAPRAYTLYLDEFEQSLDSLYRSKLNKNNRSTKIQQFTETVKGCHRLILASATALPKDVEKLEQIRGNRITRIQFIPTHEFQKAPITLTSGDGSPGSHGTAKTLAIAALEQDIKSGHSAIVACDTARQALELGILAKDWGLPAEQILVYSRDTLNDDRIQGFRQAEDKGAYLAKLGIRFLSYSPIMLSGDSIKDPAGIKLFEVRYGFLEGKTIAPAHAVQFLNRYRSSTPINLVIPHKGHFTPLIRSRRNTLEQNAAKLGLLLSPGVSFQIESYALNNDQQLTLEFQNYALAFQLWAHGDGHTTELDTVPALDLKRINAMDKVQEYKAKPIVAAEPITSDRARELQAKPEPTVAETFSLKAWKVREFHGLPWDAPLTVDLVIEEGFGRGTRQFSQLLQIAVEGYAEHLDQETLTSLGENPHLQDLPIANRRLELWEKLGVLEIIHYCLRNEYSQNDPTLRSWWDTLWHYKTDLLTYPKLLGFSLSAPNPGENFYHPMTRAIGTLLNSLGFKTKSRRSRVDDLLRIYHVTPESIEDNRSRLSRYIEQESASLRSIALVRILIPSMDQSHPPSPNTRTPQPDLALTSSDLAVAVSDRSSHCT